jgi:hypothetical protein
MADGTEVKPGQIVECEEQEIAGAMDKFELAEPIPDDIPKANAGLKMVKRPGGNLTGFDVINEATGEPINSKPLKKAETEALLARGIQAVSGEEAGQNKDIPLEGGGD